MEQLDCPAGFLYGQLKEVPPALSSPTPPRSAGFDGFHLTFTLGLGLLALAFFGGIRHLAAQGGLLTLHYDPLPQARDLDDPGQLAKAVGQYRMATLIDPASEGGWFSLGYALSKAGDRVEAARAYRHVLRLDPARADVHVALGDIDLDLSLFPEAVSEFAAAVSLEPHLARAHNGLGFAHAAMGRLEEAIRHFQIATDLTGDPLVRANLERARSELEARSSGPRAARP